MRVFSKVVSRKVRVGGEQNTGWLPEGDGRPLPSPIRDVNMNFEITDDGGSNFLLIYCSEDKSLCGDTWHLSIDEAKKVAERSFGIGKSEWQDET